MSTIMYAEDDRDCRELFAFVLRQKGHTVYEANNGAQAIQIVRDEPVDLAILDIRMPMVNGYDAAKMIAKESPHVPVMFLSAKGLPSEINKAFSCGEMVVAHLVKPITTDELLARVEHVLYRCGAHGMNTVRQESIADLVMMRA